MGPPDAGRLGRRAGVMPGILGSFLPPSGSERGNGRGRREAQDLGVPGDRLEEILGKAARGPTTGVVVC